MKSLVFQVPYVSSGDNVKQSMILYDWSELSNPLMLFGRDILVKIVDAAEFLFTLWLWTWIIAKVAGDADLDCYGRDPVRGNFVLLFLSSREDSVIQNIFFLLRFWVFQQVMRPVEFRLTGYYLHQDSLYWVLLAKWVIYQCIPTVLSA